MGDVIAFSAGDRRSGHSAAAQSEIALERAPGQILLFTGVRYQRDDASQNALRIDARPDPTSMGGGGKRRKRG